MRLAGAISALVCFSAVICAGSTGQASGIEPLGRCYDLAAEIKFSGVATGLVSFDVLAGGQVTDVRVLELEGVEDEELATCIRGALVEITENREFRGDHGEVIPRDDATFPVELTFGNGGK